MRGPTVISFADIIEAVELRDAVDVAFAPYFIDHEIDVRNVFVDTEEDLIKRLRFIEWSNGLNWGEQQ